VSDRFRALDLASLATSLTPKHLILKNKIERLLSAHSIRTDLEIALDMLTSLEIAQRQAEQSIEAGETRSWQSDASLALLNSSIILYVRATKTSSKHRRNFDFKSEFTDEQKVVHEKLCDLRNDAIAHYGPGRLDDGQSWHVEAVCIPLDNPEDLRIMTGSRRIFKQAQLQNMAKRQIHRALLLSDKFTQKCNADVVDEINELCSNEDFVELTLDHHTNLADFFTSEEEAERALNVRVGRVTGTVNH